jgi:cyclase
VVKTFDLGHRTYMLEGFGGNITIAIGEDGVIMVDSQFAPMHDKLTAAITALTPLPVRYLVNTHLHGDHTGGNALFQDAGIGEIHVGVAVGVCVESTGDVFGNRGYPNSDFLNGGSINGMIVINEKFLSIFKDDTKIVPGHGPISSKADVIAFRDMLVISRDRMAKLIAEGKATSEAEAQALKPFADLDAKWAANEQASKNWVRVVYNSLRQ